MVTNIFAFGGVRPLHVEGVLVINSRFCNLNGLFPQLFVPAHKELVSIKIAATHHVCFGTVTLGGENYDVN